MIIVGTDYTPQEMLVIAGSRVLEDNKVVFVGTGLPMIATLLARKTHAPGIIAVFEAGAVGPTLDSGLPFSVGDSRTSSGASYVRRFNKKLNYVTSPGYLDGSPEARKKAGLVGKGPYRVITTKAILGFDDKTHRMKLLQTMPGETAVSVQAATGFELLMDPDVTAFDPPAETELRMIREVIDPLGFFVKKPQKTQVMEQF